MRLPSPNQIRCEKIADADGFLQRAINEAWRHRCAPEPNGLALPYSCQLYAAATLYRQAGLSLLADRVRHFARRAQFYGDKLCLVTEANELQKLIKSPCPYQPTTTDNSTHGEAHQ